MSLHFHRAVENLDVWSASSTDISFVITFASPDGPGFRGRLGFLATWRPLYLGTPAVKVTGSPFNTFADAEAACNTMLGVLEEAVRGAAQVNNAARHAKTVHLKMSFGSGLTRTSAPSMIER